nr:hypothetical protein [Tanacetum cinerariifolium]
MAKLSFCDYHNMVAILEKTKHNTDFHQIVDFLKAFHISLQRQQSQMATKLKDQDLEIFGLKARVKSLKDKERRHVEPTQEDAPITGEIINIGEELGVEKSTKLGSNDTKEMVNVLSSMGAINILSSKGAAASVSPADVLPSVGSYKGKEKLIETKVLKKRKLQEQRDAQVAREMKEEFARENQRLSEQLVRDSEIARLHAEEELNIMIEGLDRSNEFEDFVPMSSKEESERVKRQGLKIDQGSSKRMKISEGASEEELNGMMQIVPLEEFYIKDIQRIYINCGLWSRKPSTLNRLQKTRRRSYWKLYDTCGVHHVSTKDQEIFMLVEKDYSLRKGLATVMISNKLQESLLGRILYRTPWPIKGVLRKGPCGVNGVRGKGVKWFNRVRVLKEVKGFWALFRPVLGECLEIKDNHLWEYLGDGEWSSPAGLKLARENLQSRIKEEDSITNIENAVFDLGLNGQNLHALRPSKLCARARSVDDMPFRTRACKEYT